MFKCFNPSKSDALNIETSFRLTIMNLVTSKNSAGRLEQFCSFKKTHFSQAFPLRTDRSSVLVPLLRLLILVWRMVPLPLFMGLSVDLFLLSLHIPSVIAAQWSTSPEDAIVWDLIYGVCNPPRPFVSSSIQPGLVRRNA